MNIGQYDTEYKQTECFWGEDPGKFVKKLLEYERDFNRKTAIDIGAGEGKNSFYLAKLGYEVTAVEVSKYAVKNFVNRIIRETESGNESAEKINVILCDGRKWITKEHFDLVVSYGMLHCLPSKQQIVNFINRMREITNPGGYNIIVTFMEGEPVPNIQEYLKPTFLTKGELITFYKDWDILEYEEDVIEHKHPTSDSIHRHSLCRMIAKK